MRIRDYEDLEQSKTTIKEVTNDLKKIEETKIEYSKNPPLGYLPITLSTNGSFGTPSKVWVRNFSLEDTLHLSMATEELLPEYLISVLNKNIWSTEEVNVASWAEKQVVELLLKLYANFYGTSINDITFPIKDEDIEYLRKNKKEDTIKKIEDGWKPITDIQLTNINFIDVKEPYKSNIRIKSKSGFSVLFSIPRFGDTIALKKIIKEKYYESDKIYDPISERYENNPELVSLEELEAMKKYYLEKALYITTITKAFYIKEVNGVSLEDKSYEEKIELCSDARIDFKMNEEYEKILSTLNYGIDPEVKIKNPLTGKLCARRFVFRPSDIFQAIYLSKTDGYDAVFE